LSAKTEANVLFAVLLPESVRLRGMLDEVNARLPVLVNTNAPVPDALTPLPIAPIVKSRSVVCPVPVYWSTPPSTTRLAAALVEAPTPLMLPPLVSDATESVPALI